MSKIIDKVFDPVKRIVRSIFRGAPNLFTTSDLNRQFEGIKFQLDQLDDKTGCLSDMSVSATRTGQGGSVIKVEPRFTYLQNKGMEFAGMIHSGEVLTKTLHNVYNDIMYLCVGANSSVITYSDDATHEISGSIFQNGQTMPSADNIVVNSGEMLLLDSQEVLASRATYDIFFILESIELVNGEIVLSDYFTTFKETALQKASRATNRVSAVEQSLARLRQEMDTQIENAVASSNVAFKKGMIMMWSGNTSNIPSGWHLCDGTNGTPDLRGRFILGADSEGNSAHPSTAYYYPPNTKAGDSNPVYKIDIELKAENLPSHRHLFAGDSNAVGCALLKTPPSEYAGNGQWSGEGKGAGTTFLTDSTIFDYNGVAKPEATSKTISTSIRVLPRFYAVCFIMKL